MNAPFLTNRITPSRCQVSFPWTWTVEIDGRVAWQQECQVTVNVYDRDDWELYSISFETERLSPLTRERANRDLPRSWPLWSVIQTDFIGDKRFCEHVQQEIAEARADA